MENSNDYRIIAIIPARGGSKGVPRKNIHPLAGKPLIAYTIETAKQSKYLDRVIVSTDDEEIAEISISFGAEVPFLRPESLSGDAAPTLPVLQHAVTYLEENENYIVDVLVSLQPTSPFRKSSTIDLAVDKLKQTNADIVMTVREVREHPIWMRKMEDGKLSPFLSTGKVHVRRQDLPKLYIPDGSIYVTIKASLFKEGKESGGYITYSEGETVVGIVTSGNESFDIDTILDFKMAELMMEEGLFDS